MRTGAAKPQEHDVHDFSTPFIVFSMLCGAAISISLGLFWRELQSSLGRRVVVAALATVGVSVLTIQLASLLQTVCHEGLSICRGTSDTNIFNFLIWPLLAAPIYWAVMLVCAASFSQEGPT